MKHFSIMCIQHHEKATASWAKMQQTSFFSKKKECFITRYLSQNYLLQNIQQDPQLSERRLMRNLPR